MFDDSELFKEIRAILISRTGKGLTQAEVNQIKRTLPGLVIEATPSRKGMGASKRGIDLIHSFETLKLEAYKDPGSSNGLPITIGWGSTSDLQGRAIKLGDVWTKEYADAKFAQDLAAFETGVNLLLDGAPTTQNQFDAMVSLAYNIGLDIDDDTIPEGLGDSTLLRRHKAGDFAGAQRAFSSWVFNDGARMRGLERRRLQEAALYGSQ
jgi:lysozyme